MKRIIRLLALSSLMLLTVPVSAEEIVGENSGNVEINGTLGMDNKDPDAPIVEGEDSWINVSLPTETIFYSTNTKANAPITSPKYTITNNSGRPVEVRFSKLTKKIGSDAETADYDVALAGFDVANPSIISAGNVADSSASPVLIQTLANGDGRLLANDIEDAYPNTITYGYTGIVKDELSQTIKHNFDMTLEFESVDWTTAP